MDYISFLRNSNQSELVRAREYNIENLNTSNDTRDISHIFVKRPRERLRIETRWNCLRFSATGDISAGRNRIQREKRSRDVHLNKLRKSVPV